MELFDTFTVKLTLTRWKPLVYLCSTIYACSALIQKKNNLNEV